MLISGFQKFSMIDYNDKLCAVIFTQGCNFRCPYCHNPDLVPMLSPSPLLDPNEIIDFLRGRVGKLDAVVITGGEPLLQKNLIPFLEIIKGLGYLIKLDTNGVLNHTLKNIIESGLVDYIAMDIKTSLSDYQKVAKVEIAEDSIKDSIKLIQTSQIEHEFRTTVVEGLIPEDAIEEIARNLIGSSPYFIQNFSKSHHLDESYSDKIGFSENKLQSIVRNLLEEGINIHLRS